MEQRLLRLGDIVDDYCPRERRITNHAIVAVVEDAIRQTRCTTCDAEHVYKHGKEPRKRHKDQPSSAFEEVLADVTAGQLVPSRSEQVDEPAATAMAAAHTPPLEPHEPSEAPGHTDGWLAHR